MQNVVLGWVLRRFVELGGLGVVLVQLYLGLPPNAQAALGAVLSGDTSQQNLILAIGGAIVAVGGYLWSFRATVVPQVVTTDGTKIVPKANSVVTQQIDQVAVGVQPQSLKPTIFEQLIGAFRR
jgi:hypothetical protein